MRDKIEDSFVIGYSSKGGDSALVILRPIDAEKSAEYEEVASYRGEEATKIYEVLCNKKER